MRCCLADHDKHKLPEHALDTLSIAQGVLTDHHVGALEDTLVGPICSGTGIESTPSMPPPSEASIDRFTAGLKFLLLVETVQRPVDNSGSHWARLGSRTCTAVRNHRSGKQASLSSPPTRSADWTVLAQSSRLSGDVCMPTPTQEEHRRTAEERLVSTGAGLRIEFVAVELPALAVPHRDADSGEE